MAKKESVKKVEIEDKEAVSLSSVIPNNKNEKDLVNEIIEEVMEEVKESVMRKEAEKVKNDFLSQCHKEFYAIHDIESHIASANKVSNYHLASELHKINTILCDLNHTFLHLSGEAKLIASIALKNGKVLKC